jgi:transposase
MDIIIERAAGLDVHKETVVASAMGTGIKKETKTFIQTVASEKQRIAKILEDANIKLSSIASDIFGVSGIIIIEELMKGNRNAEELAELSKGRLRRRKEELTEALTGQMEEHHTFMIRASLGHMKVTEAILTTLEQRIQEII